MKCSPDEFVDLRREAETANTMASAAYILCEADPGNRKLLEQFVELSLKAEQADIAFESMKFRGRKAA